MGYNIILTYMELSHQSAQEWVAEHQGEIKNALLREWSDTIMVGALLECEAEDLAAFNTQRMGYSEMRLCGSVKSLPSLPDGYVLPITGEIKITLPGDKTDNHIVAFCPETNSVLDPTFFQYTRDESSHPKEGDGIRRAQEIAPDCVIDLGGGVAVLCAPIGVIEEKFGIKFHLGI